MKKNPTMKNRTMMYVVTAYRWGDDESHSYLMGVFKKEGEAIKVANSHCNYRGGKYACVIEEVPLNHYSEDDHEHSKEVYRAKSIRD